MKENQFADIPFGDVQRNTAAPLFTSGGAHLEFRGKTYYGYKVSIRREFGTDRGEYDAYYPNISDKGYSRYVIALESARYPNGTVSDFALMSFIVRDEDFDESLTTYTLREGDDEGSDVHIGAIADAVRRLKILVHDPEKVGKTYKIRMSQGSWIELCALAAKLRSGWTLNQEQLTAIRWVAKRI